MTSFDPSRIYITQNQVYYLPKHTPDLSNLKLVRAGVCIGEIAKGYMKPHHQFYMAFDASSYKHVIALSLHDPRVNQYLRGEEIHCDSDINDGYCSIQVDGHAIGFGKKTNTVIKNHYPKGLRIR